MPIVTFAFDWTSVYNNEQELRQDFKIPNTVSVSNNFWITNGQDYVFVLHETRSGPIREFWRVHVWNNRDPREVIKNCVEAPIYTSTDIKG